MAVFAKIFGIHPAGIAPDWNRIAGCGAAGSNRIAAPEAAAGREGPGQLSSGPGLLKKTKRRPTVDRLFLFGCLFAPER
ncbi:MAG: hypothetical protein EOO11_01100 [Chitinophagaceae bacterium]|nr:MAG: hypothetical protein EOO11_01100 [Chitinophagaceae bacterium]